MRIDKDYVHQTLARLVQIDSEFRLAPLTGRGTYGADDEAECISPVQTTLVRFPIDQAELIAQALSLHTRRHDAPGPACGRSLDTRAG